MPFPACRRGARIGVELGDDILQNMLVADPHFHVRDNQSAIGMFGGMDADAAQDQVVLGGD